MPWTREDVAGRVARDIPDGWYVNLGVGIPTLIPQHVPEERDVIFHTENGLLGMVSLAPDETPDPEIVDAGKTPVAVRKGGVFFESSLSFAMLRGRHIDLAVVGALQVSRSGDIANWRTNDKIIGGIGGAADVCSGVQRVWLAMWHTARGELKLLERCTYPLSAKRAAQRIYSDLAVLEGKGGAWQVTELAPGVRYDDVASATGFPIERAAQEAMA